MRESTLMNSFIMLLHHWPKDHTKRYTVELWNQQQEEGITLIIFTLQGSAGTLDSRKVSQAKDRPW